MGKLVTVFPPPCLLLNRFFYFLNFIRIDDRVGYRTFFEVGLGLLSNDVGPPGKEIMFRGRPTATIYKIYAIFESILSSFIHLFNFLFVDLYICILCIFENPFCFDDSLFFDNRYFRFCRSFEVR